MYIKKRKQAGLALLLSLLIALPAGAQVATTVNGYPVIDLTALSSFGMSKRFQVSRSDNSTGSTWDNAPAACSGKTIDGSTGWRMPTISELRWIWVLHPQLVGKGGFTAFDAYYYWGSTETNASLAWLVAFSDGYSGSNYKSGSYRIRCLRDL